MVYIGNAPSTSFATVVKDSFNGGSTAYTLSKVATTNSVSVFVENVRQEPTSAYSVSGTTLTFTATTPSGTGNIYVLHMNPTTTTTHPAAQNLTAVDGTFTGNIDVDGTANLDVVDIDGALTQDGGAVFNETGASVDFRVEGDSSTNLLLVDGSADRVGINTSSPDAKLDIEGTTDAELRVTRTTASVSGNFADQGAVLNLVNNIEFENGYNGDAYTGQILFTSNDSSTGAGVRAKIAVKNTHYAHFERLMFHVSPQNTATGISTATGHDGKAVEIYKGSETTVFHIGDSTPLNIGTGYNEATLCIGQHFGIYADNNSGVNTGEMMINAYNDGSNRVYATSGRHAQRVQFDTYNGNMHFSVSNATGNADANVTFVNALSLANSSGTATFTSASHGNGNINFYNNAMYIKSNTGEVYATDSSGNHSLLSPHNFKYIPDGKSSDNAWSYLSEKTTPRKETITETIDGKEVTKEVLNTERKDGDSFTYVNVDMMKVVREVEKLTGTKLVYTGTDGKDDGSTVKDDIIAGLIKRIEALESK